jgi:hypothetical protein
MSHKRHSGWKWFFFFLFLGVFLVIFVIKNMAKILGMIEQFMSVEWDDEYLQGLEDEVVKEYEAPTPTYTAPKPVVQKAAVSKPKAKPQVAPVAAKRTVDFSLTDRQENIYQLIRKEGEIDMKSVADKISGVSDRTLRRDMTKMEKLGLIKQVGKTRNSVYKLKE